MQLLLNKLCVGGRNAMRKKATKKAALIARGCLYSFIQAVARYTYTIPVYCYGQQRHAQAAKIPVLFPGDYSCERACKFQR